MNRDAADESRILSIVEKYLRDRRSGSPTDREQLVRENPEIAAELREALVGVDFIAGAADGFATEEDPERTLGDFQLIREVGRGGMGVVYEAEQLSLRRRVAVKVLPFAAVLDPRHLQRFHHEAQAAAQLHHTHIVPVHAVGCERGVHFIVMQLIAGRSLAELLTEIRRTSRGADSPTSSSAELRAVTGGSSTESARYCRAVARLGVQAAEALDHAHRKGVTHRDVKPANLMVDGGGHLWITDFGLARSRADKGLTVTGDLLGTLRYMSPEQVSARPTAIDHRTDIYSLGVTLYELLALRPAFEHDDAQALLHSVTHDDPPALRGLNRAVPQALETVLMKATAKDAADRYETAEEFAGDLRRFLSDLPVHARRPTLLDHASKFARRHRALVAAGLIVLLVAVGALSVAAALIQREKDRAEASAGRATANLELAIRAVDEMLLEVGDDWLADVPLMEPIRRRLLERARDFHLELLAADQHDPGVRRRVAQAHRKLAAIHRMLGDEQAAERELQAAVEHGRVLGDPDELAESLYQLGGVVLLRDREEARRLIEESMRLSPPRIDRHYGTLSRIASLQGDPEQALALRRRAVDAARAANARDALAEHLSALGKESRSDSPATSLGLLSEAIELWAEPPASPERQHALAVALRRRSFTWFCEKDYEPAAADLERAEDLCRHVVGEHPAVPRYREELAGVLSDHGWICMANEQFEEAASWMRAATDAQEGITRLLPGAATPSERLCRRLHNLGIAEFRAQHWDAAERAWTRMHELASQLYEEHRDAPGSREVRPNVSYSATGVIGTAPQLPDFGDVYYNSLYDLELMASQRERWDEMQEWIQRRYEFNRNAAGTWARYARFLTRCPDRELRDARRAEALAARGVETEPGEDDHWRNLALACHALGSPERAVDAIGRAVALDRAENDEAIAQWLVAAIVHAGAGHRAEATTWLRKAETAMAAWPPTRDGLDLLNRRDVRWLHAEAIQEIEVLRR